MLAEARDRDVFCLQHYLVLFIDDIGSSLKDNSRGVYLGNSKMSHLLYADDLALIEANGDDLQKSLERI